jgi:amidohydrolase
MISCFKLAGGLLNMSAAVGAAIAAMIAFGTVTMTASKAETNSSMQATVADALAKNEQSLIEFRRDIHRHPELAGQEVRTAKAIIERMRAAGLEVRTSVGGHGVVAVLKGGKPGPVVAYRADMDAIPTTGPDPVEFKSEDESIRHGCGHDMHVTIAVGMAETLSTVRDELSGTIVFIFQPSEENGEGAAATIKDGALENPKPQAIFAVHCAPLEVGVIGSKPGMLLGGLDVVQVRLTGEGDHDPAAEAVAAVLTELNTVSMAGAPQLDGQSDFTMAGLFQAGPAEDGNGTMLVGMVRCSSDELHDAAKATIEEKVEAITSEGVTIELEYSKYMIPPVMNDPDLVARGNAIVQELAGSDALYVVDGVTPFFSEDFSQFLQHIPGALYYLGVSNTAKGTVGLPHSPMFVADEGAIVFGANTMSAILVDYLENH